MTFNVKRWAAIAVMWGVLIGAAVMPMGDDRFRYGCDYVAQTGGRPDNSQP